MDFLVCVLMMWSDGEALDSEVLDDEALGVYGKPGNGNEMETGNGSLKTEMGTINAPINSY